MLGRYIWDLEGGDVFEPIEYEVTPYICREYAHGVEENSDWFHSSQSPYGRQVRPPTLIHMDKMRLLAKNCPGGTGPYARIHYEYKAQHHSPAFVGEKLVVTGKITDRYIKRGRVFIDYDIVVKTSDGRLVTTYTDKTLLRYTLVEEK